MVQRCDYEGPDIAGVIYAAIREGNHMMTLKQYNDTVRNADVLCDECGARMEYDVSEEVREIESAFRFKPIPDGRPVKCIGCGHRGRKL